jgi:cytochrome P450
MPSSRAFEAAVVASAPEGAGHSAGAAGDGVVHRPLCLAELVTAEAGATHPGSGPFDEEQTVTETTPRLETSTCPYSELATRFDPFDLEYLLDPYPFFARARAEEPVFYSPELDYWVVSRYEDVRSVFRDHSNFSPELATRPLVPLWPSSIRLAQDTGYVSVPTLIDETRPSHTRRRRELGKAFLDKNIAPLEPRIRKIATDYIDAFVRRGHADLVAELAWELPALVIFMLMGVPDSDAATVKRFATARTAFAWGRPSEAEQNQAVLDNGAYWDYCTEHIERLRADLGADFLSDVIRWSDKDPESIDDIGVRNVMLKFLFAGHETTSGALGNAFRDLLENRDQWAALCADPTAIPQAVEEWLRLHSSVVAWRRLALADVTVGGVVIPAGAKVLLAIGSANHDEDVFADPERLDITRGNAARHVSFGFGSHLCLGAPLARLEMRVVLEELTRRLPHLRLVEGQEWEYARNISFRGPRHVLVEWDAAANPVPEDAPDRDGVRQANNLA